MSLYIYVIYIIFIIYICIIYIVLYIHILFKYIYYIQFILYIFFIIYILALSVFPVKCQIEIFINIYLYLKTVIFRILQIFNELFQTNEMCK